MGFSAEMKAKKSICSVLDFWVESRVVDLAQALAVVIGWDHAKTLGRLQSASLMKNGAAGGGNALFRRVDRKVLTKIVERSNLMNRITMCLEPRHDCLRQ